MPRSGSSFLSGLLESSGVAGRAPEWFWRGTEAELRRLWATTGERDYLKTVLSAGTTENGVFGAKVMWGYFAETLDRLRRFAGETGLTDLHAIERFAPRPRFVWMRRDDVVAQAISWSRAIQGGRWWSGEMRPEGRLSYDLKQIDTLVREVQEHDAAWHSWFKANAIDPFEVRYEELVAEPVAVASRVLAFLDLQVNPATIVAQTDRQADGLNADWAARYRAAVSR